jgi:hypothetical protein
MKETTLDWTYGIYANLRVQLLTKVTSWNTIDVSHLAQELWRELLLQSFRYNLSVAILNV